MGTKTSAITEFLWSRECYGQELHIGEEWQRNFSKTSVVTATGI